MSTSNEEKVARLLQQGLEFYGTGDIPRAFLVWNEVLELEPGNEEALDYMRDADRRAKPRGDVRDEVVGSLVEDARRIAHDQDPESALELLTSMPPGGPLENEAMAELLRARLFRDYTEQVGDLSCCPRVVGNGDGLQGRNLPPSAGFLLSMVDGVTPLADLISVSGMDRFEALRSIHRMRVAGILEWDE